MFFFIRVSTCTTVAFYIPPPLPQPFSLLLYRICTRAQGNFGKPVPIQLAILQSLFPVYSLWKMTFCLVFRDAGRGPAVTHPSTDPAPSCLTWVTAWYRTPTTHRTLSVNSYIIYFLYFILSMYTVLGFYVTLLNFSSISIPSRTA